MNDKIYFKIEIWYKLSMVKCTILIIHGEMYNFNHPWWNTILIIYGEMYNFNHPWWNTILIIHGEISLKIEKWHTLFLFLLKSNSKDCEIEARNQKCTVFSLREKPWKKLCATIFINIFNPNSMEMFYFNRFFNF